MKKSILILSVMFASATSFAQTDSVQVEKKGDTIRIGEMVILKKGEPEEKKHVTVTVGNLRKPRNNSNISTASWIVDLGFSNWIDKTNYASATANSFIVNKPGTPDLVENDFKLKTVKSVNVNIWFFMQRLNLVKHYVNLKYGLGIELNNYGDYDLEKWKFSYIAELGLGPAHLYGSYSPKSIFQNGLDYRPYNIGIRLSNW